MNQKTGPGTGILDKLIFFSMIIFILSLSNSIFINQIGYYSCLILLLIRYFVTKENPFSKTGLEIAFAWFILAEIISALLSDYQAASFVNVFKRSLLLGIVYVTLASSFFVSRTRIYFKFYIIGSIITCLIYLYHSYSYFKNNLFGQLESGPSVFQYPITSSEIMSFTVVFLFAFLINEKTNWRNRLLILAGFLISSAALFATYKRTGWLGTAFGIFIILLMRKQWKVLIASGVALIIFFMFQKDESIFRVYELKEQPAKKIEMETAGRAWDIMAEDEYYFVADYNNGVLLYKESVQVSLMETPSPVMSVTKWSGDYYLAYLLDTRFILFTNEEGNLNSLKEFVSPGFTTSYAIGNGYLYVMDSDSGLTIFKDPADISSFQRFPHIIGNTVQVDNLEMITYYPGGEIKIYRMGDDGIPGSLLSGFKPVRQLSSLFYFQNRIIASDNSGLLLYGIDKEGQSGTLDYTTEVSSNMIWKFRGDRLFGLNTSGTLLELEFPSDSIYILKKWELGEPAGNFSVNGNKISTTYNERNRLLSFVDPNHPTNFTRLNLWKTGLRIFKDYPLFGVGDIGLGYYHKKYRGYFEKEIHGHLHNNFMHILATLGLFGLLAIIFIFVKIIIVDLKIYNYLKDVPFASSYSLGALGTFVAFLFSGLTELNFGDHEIITLVWFIFGLNLAFYKNYLSVHSSEFEDGNN